ncbi:unnamed protein product [Trifolium pratense]|uniref:Uncharacterized protein n=1 Tax=Trifolium pratense TaxID=57577 RepID=A0ACB0M429_TRIPR|nr:unnamed protein product [Trifolium pratense]
MAEEQNNDFHQCRGNRRMSYLFVEENDYSALFHSGANNLLAFWLYFVVSSYFLLNKKVNSFGSCSVKPEEKVSLSNRSIPNERTDNANDALCYSESLGSPHRTCSSTYYDAFSDFDRTSYCHSLISLEDEDSAWLSDSMISENPSSPLSYNSDSFTEISDTGTPSYWDSLLKLEEEDSERNLDKASYLQSLLSLEELDSAWLSDSMISEDPSSPLSYNADSETADIGTPSYWDSLLKLDEQDNERNSSSKQGIECVQDGSPISSYKINWGTEILPSVSTISSFTGAHCEESEDVFSAEHLLETADIKELSGDEPLFWPSEGEFSWDSDESSFCCSPRKRLVFESGLKTSRIKGFEQKSFDDFGSDIDIPSEYFELDQEFSIETLVGLKEFDGHEGLDFEFIGDDGFMLEESLQ